MVMQDEKLRIALEDAATANATLRAQVEEAQSESSTLKTRVLDFSLNLDSAQFKKGLLANKVQDLEKDLAASEEAFRARVSSLALSVLLDSGPFLVFSLMIRMPIDLYIRIPLWSPGVSAERVSLGISRLVWHGFYLLLFQHAAGFWISIGQPCQPCQGFDISRSAKRVGFSWLFMLTNQSFLQIVWLL
jgi:hypothetical protein